MPWDVSLKTAVPNLPSRVNAEERLPMQQCLLCVGGSCDCHASLPHPPLNVTMAPAHKKTGLHPSG